MALGHPKGLFALFFTEMWERLAFYTMLGILLLYATDLERGGLGLPSAEGNEIYGLYLAFVYFTPFLGGMIADRFLGYRRAVALGGLMMAAGLFAMSVRGYVTFVGGLTLLILGNGFFKPNISVMVGNLYRPGDPKRDAGFNIFYMGINIGALIATLLAASVRNELGWLWTFRVAGFGLLVSLVILGLNWASLAPADRQPERGADDMGIGAVVLKILLPALAAGVVGYFAIPWLIPGLPMRPAICGFLAGMVPVIVYFVRLGLTAPAAERDGLLALLPIYVAGGTFFMILHLNGSAMTQWARDDTDREVGVVPAAFQQEALPSYYLNAGEEVPRPHPDTLLVVPDTSVARMYGLQRMDEAAVAAVAALPGVSVEEGAGPWEARAADVYAEGVVKLVEGIDSHGQATVSVEIPDDAKPARRVAFVRETAAGPVAAYLVDEHTRSGLYDGYRDRFGKEPATLPPGEFLRVVNPEVYQSFNPLFVILFTPLVVGFFGWLVARGRGLSTARKIFAGLVLTTLSLLVMALAGFLSADGSVKVAGLWLAGFYAIVTLGELCLSPMGLSLVTKLSPKRLVGLTMGGWFLATAFGNNLSGFFGGIQGQMSPSAFFLLLAGMAALVAGFIFALLPRLDRAIAKYGG
ncbi:MAG: peptide MFS transporter [Pseudomonadota bacterium]